MMNEQVIKFFQFLRAVQSQFLSQFHGFQFSFLKSVKIVMNLFFFIFHSPFHPISLHVLTFLRAFSFV